MSRKSFSEYFTGYIIVKAESLNPENFINMCARSKIILRDVERKNFTTLEFKMKYNQYKILKKMIRNTTAKTKIIKKYGVHFTYKSINRRKFFMFGSIIFIGLIVFMSSIIWNIDIEGNKKIENVKIYETLKKSGLRVGIFKYNIDLRKIEEEVLKNIKEVSVIKINFKGTKAEVHIVERTMPPNIINDETPVNIIAARAGIIKSILSYKGQSIVKSGDLVKPNQILISSNTTNTEEALTKPVHARGIVIARTWYESISEVNYDYKYELRSGKFKQKIYYIIGGNRIYIKNSNIKFKKYDKIESKNMISLIGYTIPVEKIIEYYYEKIDVYKRLDYNEAVNIGVNNAKEKINKIIPPHVKVLDNKIYKLKDAKKVRIRILYITEENIGVESKIK